MTDHISDHVNLCLSSLSLNIIQKYLQRGKSLGKIHLRLVISDPRIFFDSTVINDFSSSNIFWFIWVY
jgi:hypothetical protein